MTNKRRLAIGLVLAWAAPWVLAQANLMLWQPPQIPEVLAVGTVGLERGERVGRHGGNFVDALEAMLAGSKIDGKPALQLVSLDPRASNSRTDPFGGKPAVLLSGHLEADVKDESFSKAARQCAQASSNRFAAALGVCERYTDTTVYCTKRLAYARFSMRLTEAASKRVIAVTPLASELAATQCRGEAPMPEPSAMYAAVQADLLRQVSAQLLPSQAKVAALVTDDVSQVSAPNRRAATVLLDQLKASNFLLVCPEIESLALSEPGAASLVFAQGLCKEASGKWLEASSLHQQAAALGSANDPALRQALSRSANQIAVLGQNAPAVAFAAAAKATAVQRPPDAVSTGLSGADLAAAKQQRRVALVVGNSDYAHAPKLRNPVNDAFDVGSALQKMGFDVVRVTNAGKKQFQYALRQFQQKLSPDAVAVVYFAGHGIQANGNNYLIPVDAKVTSDAELAEEAVDLNSSVLDRLGGVRMSVLILDACRDNPFAGKTRSARGGLATISAGAGAFISFATAPGMTAADGEGRNGLYTKHLLREMTAPGRKIEDVFKRVRAGVMADSGNRQTPWENSSLTGDFYFKLD